MQFIIDFADIGEFFDQPVKRYSSGMYSRLAFSAAIAIDPEILVMDEVLAVGDEAFTRKCFARIEAIKAEGATIFFASHAANLVIELCDRAILMDHGECLLQSDPKTVISQYQRLLYAEQDRVEELRAEIRELGLEPDGVRRRAPRRKPVDEPVDYGRFDAGLVSESTVEYGVGSARIENPRILDPDGNQVNMLRPGAEYRYVYEVKFLENAYQVRFGMLFKLVTGFELGGQVSHPRGEALEKVEPGMRVQVEFAFVARLAPGTYFVNAGVLSLQDGEEVYLHRIVDALMFKVLPDEAGRITGHLDFSGRSSTRLRVELDRSR
jgi:lipopolysaccharide transport system ATP-binding protein